jgi:hypothetical protein
MLYRIPNTIQFKYSCVSIPNTIQFKYSCVSRTHYVAASIIGETCDWTTKKCMSPFAMCTGTCQCFDVFQPSEDGRCELPDVSFLGESCGSKRCAFPANCVDGTCQCVAPYRKLTDDEFWVDPTSALQCQPMAYSLRKYSGDDFYFLCSYTALCC